jgi:hypothetical protein
VISEKYDLVYSRNYNSKEDSRKYVLFPWKFLIESNFGNKLNDDISQKTKIQLHFGKKCKEEEFQFCFQKSEQRLSEF